MKKQRKHYTPQEKVAIAASKFYGWRERYGKVNEHAAPDHLRQWPAVHRQGLQGVHSDLGHDPHQNFALLSSIDDPLGAAGATWSDEDLPGLVVS